MNGSVGSLITNFHWVTAWWGSRTLNRGNMLVTDVTGLNVTVGVDSGVTGPTPLPVVGTAMELFPFGSGDGTNGGWQELDLDVESTTTLNGNKYSNTFSYEDPSPDTMPDSFIYGSTKPQWLLDAQTELGTTFTLGGFYPETDDAPPNSAIPAAFRYNATQTPVAPANVSAPTVGGAHQVGQTMTFIRGTWSGTPTPTLTSILRKCDGSGNTCSDISGQTGLTYVPVSGDAGATIRIRVTATNTAGSATVDSAQSSPITAADTGLGTTILGCPLS